MSSAQLDLVLKHIRRAAGLPGTGQGSDRRLLEDFLGRRDETAFTELVRRHGPMVLNVCRSVLHHEQDAEDAFQATFLVLAQKAGSIRQRETLAGWLWGVANHLARKAQVAAARQRRLPAPLPSRGKGDGAKENAPDPLLDMTVRDLRRALYEELQRLPEKYRVPLVLCYLEGRTQEEAAQQLGWSKGAVRGRLNRGRERLRIRLARRGLTLSAGILTTALAVNPASAAVPALLVDSTAKAALAFAGSTAGSNGLVSATVASLAAEAIKAMSVSKLKFAAVVLFAIGGVGLTVGAIAQQTLMQRPVGTLNQGLPPRLARADQPQSPSPRPQQAKADEQKQVTITGRVLDADGKPVAEAQVALLGNPKLSPVGLSAELEVVSKTKADGDGRYQLKASRATIDRHRDLRVLATAPGQGLAAQPVSANQNETDVRLLREQVIRGRLVSLQGQPGAGVKVYLMSAAEPDQARDNTLVFWDPPKDLPLWPGPVITDKQGHFTLRGIGEGRQVTLYVLDEPFARQFFIINKEQREKEITFSLAPSQVVEGRVTYADTGKPVPKAWLHVQAGEQLGVHYGMDGQADEQGRFHINPFAGENVIVHVFAPEGEPYLGLRKEIDWPKGSVKQMVDLALPRGVLIRGQVKEAGSGKPVAGAVVEFHPNRSNNPFARDDVLFERRIFTGPASGPEGRFDITVLPGKGHLLLRADSTDFIYTEVASYQIDFGRPGGHRSYYHAVVPLDLKPGADTQEVKVSFRRGSTVRGRLLGPDDKPLGKILMLSSLNPRSTIAPRAIELTGGNFELSGCEPEKTYAAYFLDPQNKLGATLQFSAKQAGDKPLTVRLEPCGAAVARCLDAEGKPRSGQRPGLEILLTAGAWRGDIAAAEKGALLADGDHVANFDRLNHWNLKTDAKGQITFPALIPGATYRLAGKKEFKVKSGETLQLGDIKSEP